MCIIHSRSFKHFIDRERRNETLKKGMYTKGVLLTVNVVRAISGAAHPRIWPIREQKYVKRDPPE